MAYPATPTRFIEVTGWIRRVSVSWKRPEGCRIEAAYCSERRTVEEHDGDPPADGDRFTDVDVPWPPTDCDDCGKPRETGMDCHARSYVQLRFSTASGRPEPGDLFYAPQWPYEFGMGARPNDHEPHDGCEECADGPVPAGPMACGDVFYARSADEPEDAPRRIATRYWHNCDGRHLLCVLPNGHVWDIDGRANNCGLPEDRLHRCWVRSGDPTSSPPTVHVTKDGYTCDAGAGSIAASDYHGFLHAGVLTAG